MKTCSIASGSSGNCYFVQTDNIFLVDFGIGYRRVKQSLEEMGHEISEVSAIFITHEHSDHTRGLTRLLKNHDIPIYMTQSTYDVLGLNDKNIKIINSNDKLIIKETIIKSFSKNHDAKDPCSFCFENKDKKACIITDVGYACDNVVTNIKDSNIIFLETNYDEHMLINGGYPHYLKERIHGKRGHLSNYDAGVLILQHASPSLKYVALSHISDNNNTPELAFNTFNALVSQRMDLNFKTIVCLKNCISEILKI